MTSFKDVCKEEWEEIKQGRIEVQQAEGQEATRASNDGRGTEGQNTSIETDNNTDNGEPHNLVGLAFSGGGIRSATFNLGVIQALAELRLLRKFDYLSTVSGGGYIGSWLTSWMASHSKSDPENQRNTLVKPTDYILTTPMGWQQCIKIKSTIAFEKLNRFLSSLWTPHEVNEITCKNIVTIEEALAPPDQNGNPILAAGSTGAYKEPDALRHLRSYTDYLKPHGGLFSMDAMTAFTTWLRNTLLNQLILITIFAAFLMVPLALGGYVNNCQWFSAESFTKNNTPWFLVSLCFATAVMFININILFKPSVGESGTKETNTKEPELPWYTRKNAVILCIVAPLIAGSFLVSIMLPSLYQSVHASSEVGIFEFTEETAIHFFKLTELPSQFSNYHPITVSGMLWVLLGACIVLFSLSSIFKALSLKSMNGNRRNSSIWLYGTWFLFATAVGLFLMPVIAELLVAPPPNMMGDLVTAAKIAKILTFGPPLILTAFMVAVFVYVGLVGREFDEHQREWWSRLVALISFAAIGWLLLFGFSIWGPLIVDYLEVGMKSAIAWLGASGIGAALGKSASSSVSPDTKGANKWLSVAAQITPYIFIFGLCLLIAYLLNVSLMQFIGASQQYASVYFSRLAQLNGILSYSNIDTTLFSGCIALFITGLFLSCRIDINVFSFHNFYRNRLTRAYLAAGVDPKARNNRKLPLTGMDDMDSPRLDRLPSRPYHILNTALNITSGKHLSWQERKAASYFFSKKFCGYTIQDNPLKDNYCPTNSYLNKRGWLSLNLPMTISGAAASPNGGYHTSPPLAFLMTVFNVRLGWWMHNTSKDEYWHSKWPWFGLIYLFKELAASVDENSSFVYLSDGGHFENLGIYELVRRECRLIVVSDAGADPKYEFEDLGNAIRKCYIDLGVRIDIDTSAIKPLQDGVNKGRSPQQSAIGLIHYPDVEKMGVLLYIKASMGDAEATDIEHYKATHSDFPHDPTANQFFTESQFESYRKLGYTLCSRVFGAIENEGDAKKDKEKALEIIKQCLGMPYKPKQDIPPRSYFSSPSIMGINILTVPYDATRKSLYQPGNADNFFQLGPVLDFNDAKNEPALCVEMSRLAYVKDESRLVRYLARAGFHEVLTIGYDTGGTQLFIAKKQDANLFVVAFRGTEPDDPTDLFTDAKFSLSPWTDDSGRKLGEVHTGFAKALLDNDILKRIKARIGTPSTRILLTGHSLGAAIATLAASWMTDAHLYTFGCPLVGNQDFAAFMQSQVKKYLRYVDCCDLVTRVPPLDFGYAHSGELRYIDRNGEVQIAPSDTKIGVDRIEAATWYLTHRAFLPGTVAIRELADHAPINYVSGVMGLR